MWQKISYLAGVISLRLGNIKWWKIKYSGLLCLDNENQTYFNISVQIKNIDTYSVIAPKLWHFFSKLKKYKTFVCLFNSIHAHEYSFKSTQILIFFQSLATSERLKTLSNIYTYILLQKWSNPFLCMSIHGKSEIVD